MKKVARKKLIITALAVLAVFVIIILALFAPLQRTPVVLIVSSVGIGEAENDTEMESIKVGGTFWNEEDMTAKNLTATVIFTDAAHNKVVRKVVKEGVDLLPNKGLIVEFDSEYLREKTIPKTEVNVTIQFDWMEDGQLKTLQRDMEKEMK
ncbi:hypothetical protein ANME2D_00146 [Candidatus Methanoperedens nitroreducens]|uniref:Uncharacterized protein n=1 Tax=Candidatus Methanoperedens nitratireducens TaxID=1392998 RepID=A0A062V6Z9_9EURY|nr:hypothetical protein [Candidatus Methanoperedens nitroreducens]KCZ73087.1 hypothetical protein ANME2D_00146 [Candidatus Methanoperedens nitroreducens]MDJ1422967.1 hypothetical protein [Candidatus Methanoperedens sp.]